MQRVYICLTTQHDWRLVVLAGIVCIAVCCAAIGLLYRSRALNGTARGLWLVVAGFTAGSGIWATHFIAMLAYEPSLSLSYNFPETVLSLLIAIVATTAGFAWALYGQARWSAAAGGCVVGGGIACMHYVGIDALDMYGQIVWRPELLVASILFGIAFAAAALELASGKETGRRLLGSAALLALAILTHHFTALSAAAILPVTAHAVDPNAVTSNTLAFTIAAVAALVVGLCSVAVWWDRQAREQLDRQSAWLDLALNNMNQGLCMFSADRRLLVWNARYVEMYKIDPRYVKVGAKLAALFAARIEAGTFPINTEEYYEVARASFADGVSVTQIVELGDSRLISVTTQPIAGGGIVATHEDITERVHAERTLEQTRSFLNTIIENVPTPIIVKSAPDLRYLLVNRAAEKYYGSDRAAILGRTAAEIMPQSTADTIDSDDRKIVERCQPIFFDEHAVVTPGNGTRIVTASRLPVFDPEGKLQYVITVIDDLTERKRSEQRIAHMAQHDLLTDLPNRLAFDENIAAKFAAAVDSKESFAIIDINLDRFKAINNDYGHAVGDGVLREAARRMEAACEDAFLARVGGDEFVVITTYGPQPAGVESLTARLRTAFETVIDVDGHALRVGMTMGAAIYPQDGADASTLIANVNAALFRAKSEARGSIRFFDPAMDRQLREKRALERDLRTAVMNGELALYYQPQANIGGKFIGFEALARWTHPRLGAISPATFIPLAEEAGIINALGEWVLRTACREAASWPTPLHIAVNLSPKQFEQGDLPALVHTILLETGLAPARLEFEITEGVLIGDFNRAVMTLRRLKGLGVRIAMDDFGIGYSSLTYLQAFPFDKIKIDQSFIANLQSNRQSAAIIRAVIALSHGLSVPASAEGVETEDQLKFLTKEGCDEIQGYLIGRPQPISYYAGQVGRVPTRRPKSLAAIG